MGGIHTSDRDQWLMLVNEVISFLGFTNCWEFIDQLSNY
jgi:hypothetical protein